MLTEVVSAKSILMSGGSVLNQVRNCLPAEEEYNLWLFDCKFGSNVCYLGFTVLVLSEP